jgi:hypothetical protein
VTAPGRASRLSPWGRLVAASATLVVGAVLLVVGWGVASGQERQVSYAVQGSVNGLALDVGSGDVEIVGIGRRPAVEVVQRARYAFGHDVLTRRSVAGGVFRLRGRCPTTVITRSCSVGYRLLVPDNVPVSVRTAGGSVSFRDYRGSARVTTGSGDVHVDSFCGFSLQVRSGGGDVVVDASCAPQRLSLRTTSGSIQAIVPPGRYRLDADSGSGPVVVRGLTSAPDAVFELQALSTSGAVRVETRG